MKHLFCLIGLLVLVGITACTKTQAEVSESEVEKAFEKNYLKSTTISPVVIAGQPGKSNAETLQDYKIKSVKKVVPDGPVAAYQLPENKVKDITATIWEVTFDVMPKHNPEADIDPSKSPYRCRSRRAFLRALLPLVYPLDKKY